MSASPTPYASNGVVHQRHPFRRQGSSYGPGHVQPMALMVHHPRVDYSINKGGLKTWAVLLVFVLLCSALVAIFSEEQESPYNDDEYVVQAEDLSRPAETEANDEIVPDVQPTADVEEEEDESEEQEISLFAALREKAKAFHEKAKQNIRKIPAEEQEKEEEKEEEEPAEPRHVQRRRERQRQAAERAEAERLRAAKEADEPEDDDDNEEEKDDSNEKEDEPEPEEEEPPKAKRTRQTRRPEKEKPISEEEDDDDDDEDDGDQEEDDEEEEKPPARKTPLSPISKVPVNVKKEADEQKEEEDDDDDDDNSEEQEDEEELVLPRGLRRPRRKGRSGVSWHRSVQAEQMAGDKHNPRMSLLKRSGRRVYPKLDHPLTADSNEEKRRNSNENDADETTEETAEVHELVATRKRANFHDRKATTNRHDYKHREELEQADYLAEKHQFDEAVRLYEAVLADYRESPRAQFGIARVLQLRSEFEDDDSLLDRAIADYQKVLDNFDTPEELFKLTADHLVECARYKGNLHKVMTVQREVIDRFPDDLNAQNEFGMTFLMMGRPEDARRVFTTVLETDPNNGVAQAYFGYLLKVYDHDYERGVQFMKKGLKTHEEPIRDAKFYFHLGEALERSARGQEALRVYEEAVELGLFPSVYQRSTYNLEGLTARSWWSLQQTRCARQLKNMERQWTAIREEAQRAWTENPDRFVDEDPHISEGVHRALVLRAEHSFDEKNCRLVPTICQILKDFSSESKCEKGDMKISVMTPGSRVWPHCAPTNFVLEAQLGLVAPSEARIRVGKDVKGWKTGKFLVFDPSFEHELWFDGAASTAVRIVLSIDLWHPEVPATARVDTVY
ncbi:TPR-REGION domain-containing protein [Aphelenchoides fujianensis]|nr:TPR-REGION domain-containing protein [Aphelenchoides fujianensis]